MGEKEAMTTADEAASPVSETKDRPGRMKTNREADDASGDDGGGDERKGPNAVNVKLA